jgi:hypothetical protein
MDKKKSDNVLLYIPKRKHNSWELKDGIVYLVFYHRKFIEKFFRWLVKKPDVTDIKLDRIGSCVWKLIDGNKTIYEVGQELKNELGEKCEPIYQRLIMYLRYLNRMGWISFERGAQK